MFRSTLQFILAYTLGLAIAGSLAGAQTVQTFEQASFTPPDDYNIAHYGGAVAIRGDRMVVGAEYVHVGEAYFAGAVYVYEKQQNGAWAFAAQITASDAASGDGFGTSVAIDNNQIIVGADTKDTEQGANAGKAYIYERQNDGTWSETGSLYSSIAQEYELFGWAVAIDGDTAAVGAFAGDSISIADCGAVDMFKRVEGHWIFSQRIVASDAAAAAQFGNALSLRSGALVAGARSEGMNSTGAAYVFRLENNSWTQEAKLSASNGNYLDYFGWSVCIDGDRVAVGAPAASANAATTASGIVYIYERANGVWSEAAMLAPAFLASEDSLGWSVSIRNNRLLAGAPGDVGMNPTKGSIYIFEDDPNQGWILKNTFQPTAGEAGEFFGGSVDFDGEWIAAGAYVASNGVVPTGRAYVVRSCNDCAVAYGAGTPGCDGTQTLYVKKAPAAGAADFAIYCDNAPQSSLGLGIVGNAQDLAGSDLFALGVLLHVDLIQSTEVLALDFYSDAKGNGGAPAPIPNDPNLVGQTFYVCGLWAWTACALPPLNLSSTRGLALTLLAP